MVSGDEGNISRKRRKIGTPKAAPYIFRSLFEQVPVVADDAEEDVHITCVEYWSELFALASTAED
jgi:hypothetical protein